MSHTLRFGGPLGLAVLACACFYAFKSPASAPEPGIASCRAVDGDTLHCGDERIRLLGIDAPELPGHCRRGRACVPGDGYASRESLAAVLERLPRASISKIEMFRNGGRLRLLTIQRLGRDRYGRTLALVSVGGVDLSCYQLQRGQAVYVERWDNGGRLAALCSAVH